MRNNREYQICRDIALYMKLQYPAVLYHFDLAGLNLSRAQAGMMKAIQDHIAASLICLSRNQRTVIPDCLLRLRPKEPGCIKRTLRQPLPHLPNSQNFMDALRIKGYKCEFGVGWDNCKEIIDSYLK